jgi:uncharacterized protein YndB with AHSA1/START domain
VGPGLIVGALVRLIVRLAPLGIAGAWLLDRRLHGRAAGAGPAPIRTSVAIDAPIGRVWAILANIERQPEWMHDLKTVRITTPPPVGVGTRGVGRVQVFGIAVEDPVEVTAFEPPTHFAIRHEGLVTGGGDIRLAPSSDGTSTIVTWDETLIPPVLPHLGGFVLAMVLRPIFRKDLERLAAIVEAD